MIYVNTQIGQENADLILSKHVNKVLQEMMEKILFGAGYPVPEKIDHRDKDFCMKLKEYLPKSFPEKKIGETFLSVYHMVRMQETFAPNCIFLYVIHSVIKHKLDQNKNLGISLIEPLEDFDELMKELALGLTVPAETEESLYAMTLMNEIRNRLKYCEDISVYPVLCGCESDIEYLDILSEKQLKYMIKDFDHSNIYILRNTA